MPKTIQERFDLITRNTEEVIEPDELKAMLDAGEKIKHYIGFEISGKIHLGTGLMCLSKVKDFMDAGIDCTIFLADWHAWINDKLGGDRELIKKVGVGYFKEGLKASFKCIGGDPAKLTFVLGTELYHNNDTFWATLIDVSKNVTLGRIQRSITILGRKEGDAVDFAKMIYPPMQVADIFAQGITLAHAGLDQRKAHVVAREVATKLTISPLRNKKKQIIKPIAIHHHLLLGLQHPASDMADEAELATAMKMSKSVPDSAIFITDTPEEIQRKMKKAFCPEKVARLNPVLDWAKHIVFTRHPKLVITRPQKFGGAVSYTSYESLEADYVAGKIHPLDLKNALAEEIIRILEPARKHFETPAAKKLKAEMDSLLITR